MLGACCMGIVMERTIILLGIVIEAAAPPPVVRQVVPVSGADNSYNFTVTGLTADEVVHDVVFLHWTVR